MKDLRTVLEEILPIVREAGAGVRAAKPHAVGEKSGHNDLVTEIDVNTQRFLIARLSQAVPGATFLGEEDDCTADVEHGDCFVIDPIDGTTNFVFGYEQSAVSVGMLRDGEPVIGVVCQPWKDRLYYAVRGGGAFCDGIPLHASEKPLCDSLAHFGTSLYYPELRRRTVELTGRVMDAVMDIRRSGSAALDLCDVAAGHCGAFFELRLSPWDYAAGAVIVTEAGGVITDEYGAPVSFSQKSSVAAGGKKAHPKLLALFAETR